MIHEDLKKTLTMEIQNGTLCGNVTTDVIKKWMENILHEINRFFLILNRQVEDVKKDGKPDVEAMKGLLSAQYIKTEYQIHFTERALEDIFGGSEEEEGVRLLTVFMEAYFSGDLIKQEFWRQWLRYEAKSLSYVLEEYDDKLKH